MAQFNYARSKATAERLIRRFGQTVTLTVISTTGPGYNPTVTETDHSLQAAVLDYKINEIDGTLVQRTDRKVLVSTEGATVTPSTANKITIGGAEHAILSVKPLNPGGTVVMWELQTRK